MCIEIDHHSARTLPIPSTADWPSPCGLRVVLVLQLAVYSALSLSAGLPASSQRAYTSVPDAAALVSPYGTPSGPGAVLRFDPLPARISLVRGHLQREEWKKAEEELGILVRLAPAQAEIHVLLGIVALHQKQLGTAVAYLRQAITLDGRNAEARFYSGLAMQLRCDWKAAAREYEAAISLNPGSEPAWLNLAVVRERAGNLTGAASALEHAAKANPHNQVTRRELALLRRAQVTQRGPKDPAVRLSDAHVDQAQLSGPPRRLIHDLADTAAREQRGNHVSEAISAYRQLSALRPGDASILLNLGSLYAQQHRWSEAEQALTRAAQLEPTRADGPLMRALLPLARKKPSEAEAALREVTNRFPQEPRAWQAMAYSQLQQEKTDAAAATYERAISLFPRDMSTYRVLAELYDRLNRTDQAVGVCKKALAVNPGDAGSQAKLTAIWQRQGKWDELERIARAELSRDPHHASPHVRLAQALEHNSDPVKQEEALQQYREACRLAHKDVASQLAIARLLAVKGERTAATRACEALLQENPDCATAYEQLGALYEGAKAWPEATATYRRWWHRAAAHLTPASHSPAEGMASAMRPMPPALVHLLGSLDQLQRATANANRKEQTLEPDAIADEELGRALKVEARWVEVRLRLIGVEERQKVFTAALRTAEEGLMATPEDLRLYDAARRIATEGKLGSLLPFYRTLAARHPRQPAVYEAISDACARDKNPAQAIEELRAISAKDPGNVVAWRALAQAYHENGDPPRVISTLRHLTEIEPANVAHALLLAKQLEIYGNKDAALVEYDRWLDATPRTATASTPGLLSLLSARAGLCDKMGKPTESADTYERILKVAPTDPNALLSLGQLLEKRTDLNAALSHYKRMVATLPEHPNGYAGVLRVANRLGRREEAERFWETLVVGETVRPADVSGRRHVPDSSASEVQRAVTRRVLDLYFEREGADAARRLANSWAEKRSDLRPMLLEACADYYRRYGRRADLIAVLEELGTVRPNDSKVALELAAAFERDGKTERALEAYRKALALDSRDAASRFAAARLLEQLGRSTEALVHYRAVVKIQQEYPGAVEAIKRLTSGASGTGAPGGATGTATSPTSGRVSRSESDPPRMP